MLLEANVVGKKTDWANYITLADEHQTPMLRTLPKGPKPVNVIKHYQTDSYDEPTTNAWPDGKDWTEFKSAGANRGELTARCQWFLKTAAVSKLAQDVTDTAGITDALAHEIPKKMTEMARDMEAAAASDQGEYQDDGVTGHKYRGMGTWIQSGAQTDGGLVVPAAFRPTTDQVYNDIKANLYEDQMRVMLEGMWTATGSEGRKMGFVGSKLKKRFREFQDWIPTSTTVQSQSRVTFRDQDDDTLGNVIDYYESDWGVIELHMTRWNAHKNLGGSFSKGQWRGYFINGNRWAWLWNQKPTVYKPEFKGGSYKAAIDAIAMLLCWNPIGEGKVDPSDA